MKRTTRDPVSMADAIVESERTRARADRQRQIEGARDAGSLDVADLLVAGVGLVWKVLTR